MQNRRVHRMFLAILFMLSLPLMVYSQWLPFQSQYLIKHTNGEDEIYSLYQVGNKKIGEKEYEYFIDFKNNEFFCRIEDDKLIRFDESDEKEYVICDYNLKEGDIFDTRDGRKMKVIQVGDSLLDSFKDYPCYCINLMNIDDPFDTDLWVKFTNSDYVYYMGSYNNLFMFPEELDDFSEHHLLWNNYGFVNILNTENVKTQMMKVERKDDYLSFDEETGEIFYPSDSLHCEFVKDTLVVSGRVFTNCSYKHYLVCHVQGQQIFLEVMAIPPSAACESSHYFTAKFPGFKPGEYTFELNSGRVPPSGIKEITGDLVCKEYITIAEPMADYLNKFWTIQCFDKNSDGKITMKTINLTDYTFNERENNTTTFGDYSYVLYNDTHSPKTLNSNFYFREENGKVYRYDEQASKENQAFDFNLNAGDTFTKTDGTIWEVYEKGLAKDIPSYCDKYFSDRTMLKLRERGDVSHEDIWIEGVGSIYTGILDKKDIGADSCFVESMYRAANSYDAKDCSFFNLDNCSYKSVIGETYRFTAEDVAGTDYTEWCENGSKIEAFFIDDTLCIKDYTFTFAEVNTIGALVNGNHIDVYVNEAYSLSSSGTEQLVRIIGKIPGFKQGEYTLHFPESDQSDTTIVCHGPATGIQDINTPTNKRNNNAIYDLQGRLVTVMKKGIYIHNGKKIIK